jgi:hypothetical protein
MGRNNADFNEFGKDVFYHGTEKHLRDAIAKEGLTEGFLDPSDAGIAREYGLPDIYAVKKHKNMEPEDEDDPNGIHVIADTIPPKNIKRVGHVINHYDSNGEVEDELHWHKAEDCPTANYDITYPKGYDVGETMWTNIRPHPTDPTRGVANWK